VKESTVRNKTKQPIMTLTPAMLAKMLAARPESVSLVLAKHVKDYKEATGKHLVLDHEQDLTLREHAGANASGMWTSRYVDLPYPMSQVKPLFSDGFMMRSFSSSMSEDLVLAEAFHTLLDTQLTNAALTAS